MATQKISPEVQDIRITNLEKDIAFYTKAALLLYHAQEVADRRTNRHMASLTETELWQALHLHLAFDHRISRLSKRLGDLKEALRVAKAERGY